MKKSYSPGSAFVISMSSPKTVNISAMVLSVRFTVAVKCACSLPDWISLIRLIYRDFLSGLPPILPDKRDIYAPSVDVLEPIPLPMDPKADLTPCKPCLARHRLNATVSAFFRCLRLSNDVEVCHAIIFPNGSWAVVVSDDRIILYQRQRNSNMTYPN